MSYSAGIRNQHVNLLGDTWLTPPGIIEALGPFDTDPCCPNDPMPWKTAARMITEAEDSLALEWDELGRIWLNPPYGPRQWEFIGRLAVAGDGIALVRARTNVCAFHEYAWSGEHRADAVFFFGGAKLTFHEVGGQKHRRNDPMPSVLLIWGEPSIKSIKRAIREGKLTGTLLTLGIRISNVTPPRKKEHGIKD
jgi:DNA N-6-adenine-methyltransferase (Dam)